MPIIDDRCPHGIAMVAASGRQRVIDRVLRAA
jgi:hypothetical protein